MKRNKKARKKQKEKEKKAQAKQEKAPASSSHGGASQRHSANASSGEEVRPPCSPHAPLLSSCISRLCSSLLLSL